MSFSISVFFKDQKALNRYKNCGFFSSYLDSFSDWLGKHKFSINIIRRHISHVAHFSYSLEGIEPDIQDLDTNIQTFYSQHIPTCTCEGWWSKNIIPLSKSINRFKDYLCDCHGMKFEMDELAYKEIYNEYLSWLSEKLQLANLTIRIRSSHIKQFLQWYKETSNYQALQQITPYDVELFFIKATSRLGVSTTGLLKVVLRSFFDFCHEQGYTTQNLRYSIPVIRTYQLSDIPKKIEDHEALKLIDSIDRSTVNGKRTYAILLLLYTYGVRGCQIRSLKVKDIDWHKEEIHFHSVKNSKSLCFPLTSNVGNALFEYLKYARKKCQYKEFFLTLCAPVKPLEAWGISQIVRRSMVKVGIKSPSKGAHCFRHGFVSRMLKQGESFKNISDLLGHKHIKTTFIYTKIDFNSLSEVALQLPEVDNENV